MYRYLKAVYDSPLLCVSLPEGAADMEVSTSHLEIAVHPSPFGTISVRGPLPSGRSALGLRYTLPTEHGSADLTREAPLHMGVASLFIADTGVIAESSSLHRRRPFRSNDRIYMQFEGFEIERGEVVDLTLRRLPPRSDVPRTAALGFAVVAAAAAAVFLAIPLRQGPEILRDQGARRRDLQANREAIYAQIHDLDEDFETDKLDAEEHREIYQQLRAKAVALLKQERELDADSSGDGPTTGE